ncbi:MAG: pilus assembly protein CpaE [Rhizorhabdus sp.]
MNAPWKGAAHGTRDPFAAFVNDEPSLEVLRAVAAEMGWPPEKCQKGGLRNAVQSLSIAASPNILLVDLSECNDPLNEINTLAEVCEPGTLVVAVGPVNDVRLYRDLLSSGIHEYLLKPLTQAAVLEALTAAQTIITAPRNPEPGAVAKKHLAAAVVGTRGGVGASLLATSLAWLFSTEHKLPTALLDLDVHFGTGALAMDLEPGRGLTDAIDNPSRIDGLFIERAMIRANEHLAILSAEAPIGVPLLTDGSAFVRLEEEFRQAFEMTVVDLPRNMLINFPGLLANVGVVVLATELTLASARDAIRLLAWLRSGAANARPIVVANKVQAGLEEISRADFESSIERKIDFMVPFDAKAAANAAKLGQTFAEANRSAKASQVLHAIAKAVIGAAESEGGETPPPARKSLFGRIGDLRTLRPAKARK